MVLPSFIILLLIAMYLSGFRTNPYVAAALQGMRPAVVALIAVPFVNFLRRMNWWQVALSIAVSQMTPGPIAINCATYVGYMVTGNIWGSILATGAVSLPPPTIMLLITRYYFKLKENRIMKGALDMMKPMIVGMMGAAALLLCNRETFVDWSAIAIFVVSFVAVYKKFNPILLLVISAAAGLILYL